MEIIIAPLLFLVVFVVAILYSKMQIRKAREAEEDSMPEKREIRDTSEIETAFSEPSEEVIRHS